MCVSLSTSIIPYQNNNNKLSNNNNNNNNNNNKLFVITSLFSTHTHTHTHVIFFHLCLFSLSHDAA